MDWQIELVVRGAVVSSCFFSGYVVAGMIVHTWRMFF